MVCILEEKSWEQSLRLEFPWLFYYMNRATVFITLGIVVLPLIHGENKVQR